MTAITRKSTSLLAGLLCLTLAVSLASAQEMPAPSIAVLDIQRILRESLAAKSVVPQMQKLRTGYQNEVRRQESELRKADQELAQKRALLAPEAYAKRRQAFEQRAKEAQRKVQARKRVLETAVRTAMGKVQDTMFRVAKEVAEERKINIVLRKSVVVLSIKSLDITSEILRRLNEQLPSVTVVLPEETK